MRISLVCIGFRVRTNTLGGNVTVVSAYTVHYFGADSSVDYKVNVVIE
jgi:hypothetical protein